MLHLCVLCVAIADRMVGVRSLIALVAIVDRMLGVRSLIALLCAGWQHGADNGPTWLETENRLETRSKNLSILKSGTHRGGSRAGGADAGPSARRGTYPEAGDPDPGQKHITSGVTTERT